MKITIRIENCESVNELYSHLNAIKQSIRSEAKIRKVNGFDEFEKPLTISDMNCYGEHYVKIKP